MLVYGYKFKIVLAGQKKNHYDFPQYKTLSRDKRLFFAAITRSQISGSGSSSIYNLNRIGHFGNVLTNQL